MRAGRLAAKELVDDGQQLLCLFDMDKRSALPEYSKIRLGAVLFELHLIPGVQGPVITAGQYQHGHGQLF